MLECRSCRRTWISRRKRSTLTAAASSGGSMLLPAVGLSAQEKKSDTLFTVDKFLDLEQVADPQISPDGSQIVYTRRYVNKLEDRFDGALWIMSADGTKNRFLTKGSGAR